jgi:hypothetical protein
VQLAISSPRQQALSGAYPQEAHVNDHKTTAPCRPRRKRGRPRIYGFDELKPGESFLIAGKTRDSIAPCLYAAQRRTGFKFVATNTRGGVIVGRPSWDRPSLVTWTNEISGD